MKPTIGRIVTAVGFKARGNGAEVAPAIITRVWSQREDGAWGVNVKIFRDASSCQDATSCYLYDSPDAARAAYAANDQVTAIHWPEREQ